ARCQRPAIRREAPAALRPPGTHFAALLTEIVAHSTTLGHPADLFWRCEDGARTEDTQFPLATLCTPDDAVGINHAEERPTRIIPTPLRETILLHPLSQDANMPAADGVGEPGDIQERNLGLGGSRSAATLVPQALGSPGHVGNQPPGLGCG